MRTEAAKWIYRLRSQTAEWVNAPARNRGFWFIPVRCQRCRVLFAIAHELVVAQRLRQRKANRETDRQSVKTGQKSVRLFALTARCSRIESGRRS